jgi:TetR/AcrR family transcriptional regulator, mexJK operon transcriptional repressor
VVVAEGIRFPDLARIFFEAGPGRASARLAVVLEEFRRRGEIKVDDSRRGAERFIGMLRDDLHLKVLLGLRPSPNTAEIDRSVRQAVHIFLHGCRGIAKTAAQRKRVTGRPTRK